MRFKQKPKKTFSTKYSQIQEPFKRSLQPLVTFQRRK